MKTTSIITITGALALIVLALTKINGGSQETEARPPLTEKSQTPSPKNNGTLVDILPFKDLQTDSPFYDHPIADVTEARSHRGMEDMNTGPDQFLNEIVFLEEEEQIDLGFDVNEYLPADFNPYASAEPDLNEIGFIEEEEINLGFDTALYLPIGFDAFAVPDPDLKEIVFIEDEDAELGFDTQPYLPENFDPYTQPEPDLDAIAYIEEEPVIELGFDVNAYLPAGFDPYAAATFDPDNIIFLEEEEEIELWEKTNTGVQEEPSTNVDF